MIQSFMTYIFENVSFITIIYFALGGLLSGFTAGLLGAGGGAILVPVLLFLLPHDQINDTGSMHQAVTTSLAVMVFSAAVATWKQYTTIHFPKKTVIVWLPFVTLGAISANYYFSSVPDKILKYSFVGYLMISALYMILNKKSQSKSDLQPNIIPLWMNVIFGGLVGVLSTFLGIGGATFTVPYFTIFIYSLKSCFAISSATSLLVALISLTSELLIPVKENLNSPIIFGYVNVLAVVLVSPFSMIGSYLGVKVNHFLPDKILRLSYIMLLIFVGLYMINEIK